MVEPLPITDELQAQKEATIDSMIERVNLNIKQAREIGLKRVYFPIERDENYYLLVKRRFEKAGYIIQPTGYIGGVLQKTEDIYW